VVIADGQATSPAFAITAVDDALLDGTQTVTITATATGYQTATDTLDVTDDDESTTTVSLDGDDLVVEDTGGDTDDTLTFKIVGDNLVISDPNNTIGTQIVVATGDASNEIVVPLSIFAGELLIDVSGGNDSVTLDPSIDDTLAGRISLAGGPGEDSMIVEGADIVLDLSQFTDVDHINISGAGNNTLNVNLVSALNNVDNALDSLVILSNLGDTVAFDDGWSLTTTIEDGTFFRVVEQNGAKLLLNGPANWQNPINRHDVNNDGLVSPVGDILPLINEINRPRIISANGVLPVQPVEPNFPVPFYDVNGDGHLTPVGDILVQINLLNSQTELEGESRIVRDNTVSSVEFLVEFVIHGGHATLDRHSSHDAMWLASLVDAETERPPYSPIRLGFSPQPVPAVSVSAIDRLVAEDLDDLLSIKSDLEIVLDEVFAAFE